MLKSAIMPDTFQCEECGGIFNKSLSEEEAEAEAKVIFGVDNASTAEGMAIVCDDCFGAIMTSLSAKA
jgi:hypothetical protein